MTLRVGSDMYLFGGQTVEVLKIIPHPLNNPVTNAYDVSVLVLKNPLKFSKNVNSIKMASREYADNTISTVSGWGTFLSVAGMNVPLVPSPLIQYADVPLINRGDCQKSGNGAYSYVDNTMICAGLSDGGKDCK